MENTQRFCPGEGRCKFLHKYKFPGQPSRLSICSKIFIEEKQSRPDLMSDDGIVVCISSNRSHINTCSNKNIIKSGLNFLTRNLAGGIYCFFVYVLSGTALDYHLYMYITTLHVGLFLP